MIKFLYITLLVLVCCGTTLSKQNNDKNDNSSALKINGWTWKKPPRENRITHSGEIVFKFTIDEYGDISSITIVSSSFTKEENEWLKEKLYNVRFVQTSSGRPPELTEGTLVWRFKPR